MLDNEASNRDNDAALDAAEARCDHAYLSDGDTCANCHGIIGSSTVTISIGRNVGPRPLPLARWAAFIEQVRSDLDRVGATAYFDGDGLGDSAVWGKEDAHTWVVSVPHDLLGALRVWLSVTAYRFEQDEIAWTWGRYDGVRAAVEVQDKS
jgi:hypothetical protein